METVERITLGETTYNLPYTAMYRPWTPAEAARNRASIEGHGVREPIRVDESNNVIDGANRLRTAHDLNLPAVPVVILAGLTDQEKQAESDRLNLYRRHLSVQEQQAAVSARRKRVGALRQQGMSVRAIAEQAGVGRTQIERDLESSRVPGGTRDDGGTDDAPPAPLTPQIDARGSTSIQPSGQRPDSTDSTDGATSFPQPITGADGKVYPAHHRPDVRTQVITLLTQHPDWTQARIAEAAAVRPSYVSKVFNEERANVNSTNAADFLARVTATQRAQLDAVARKWGWTEAVLNQALMNIGSPYVPESHKEHLLRGEVDPLIYTVAGELRGTHHAPRRAERKKTGPTLTEEQRARLDAATRARNWTDAMRDQAERNVLNPYVPHDHNDRVLAGEEDPFVFDANGRVRRAMSSRVRPVLTRGRVESYLASTRQTIEQLEDVAPSAQAAALLTKEDVEEWVTYVSAVRRHLFYATSIVNLARGAAAAS